MTDTDLQAYDGTTAEGDDEHLVATPDRRFYAFVIDRLIAWTLFAVAAWAAYRFLIEPGDLWAGVGAIVGAVLVVSFLFALATGLWGTTPGKAAVGLKVLAADGGQPIGIGRALYRTFILGVATLPTIGFGAAALAWTAMMDGSGSRRAWHDLRAGSVVVDVRPLPEVEEEVEEAPRQVVNLTAMRLVPASPTPPQRVPTRGKRPQPEEPQPVLSPIEHAPPASTTPRQGLGWPLVGSAPVPEPEPAAPAPPPPAVTPLPSVPVAPPPAPAAPAAPAPPAPGAHAAGVPPAQRSAPVAPQAGQRVDRTRPQPSPSTSTWRVAFDTGEAFEVRGLTLVGRKPEPRQGEPVKRLVQLPSDDMSLSKTHAQFQVVPDGALVVMDRGSTNGSLLVRAGVTKRLTGGKPATLRDGDRVRFGDREMTVARIG